MGITELGCEDGRQMKLVKYYFIETAFHIITCYDNVPQRCFF